MHHHHHHHHDAVVWATLLPLVAGALIAAVLGYVSSWRTDRDRDQRRARGAARLFARDLYRASIKALSSKAHQVWPPEPSYRFPTANWERLASDFSASVRDGEAWNAIAYGFEKMQLENDAIEQGEAKFDPARMDAIVNALAVAREALKRVSPTVFDYPVVPTREEPAAPREGSAA